MKKIIYFVFLFALVTIATVIQPVNAVNIAACTDITAPGTYVLTSDILNSAKNKCINITANNVFLDCDGYRIDGQDTNTYYGVYSTGNYTKIKNCNVTDWDFGISCFYNWYCQINDSWASSNDVDFSVGFISYDGDNMLIHNVTSYNNDYGILNDNGTDMMIENSTVYDCDVVGLFLDMNPDHSIVRGNTITNTTRGIEIQEGDNVSVYDNIIEQCSTYGITMSTMGQCRDEDGAHACPWDNSSRFYNNLFNNTNNVNFGPNIDLNYWNTTNQTGTRITGSQTNIGGNYYTNSTGGGYSVTCADVNSDGFCDNSLTLTAENIDYLPLSDEYDCVNATEDMSITSDTTLCSGTYYLNDTGGDGVIRINDNGITLNCNGATLQGNGTSGSVGVMYKWTSIQNWTVKNCNIKNYGEGVKLNTGDNITIVDSYFSDNIIGINALNNAERLNISNNRFDNSTNYGLKLKTKYTTVTNNFFNNSNYSIYFDTQGEYNNIINNDIYDTNESAIWFDGGDDYNILNNVIINSDNNNSANANTKGIYSANTANDNNISHNKINGFNVGIYVSSLHNNTYVSYNNVSNQGLWGIAISTGNNSIISNNKGYNSSWNIYVFTGYYHTINDNYAENFKHHGLDIHNDNNITIAGHSRIYNNNITISDETNFASGGAGMYIQAAINISIFDNIIYDITTTSSRGIAITGGNQSYNNNVYNNTINNISTYCLYDSSLNTTYETNTMIDCSIALTFGNFPTSHGTTNLAHFLNNNWNDGYTTYKSFSDGAVNFTVNETSTSYHLVILSNGGTITFTGDWRKQFDVENNSIRIYNLAAPNDDIYNATGGYVIADGQTNYNITIPAGQQIWVGDSSTFITPFLEEARNDLIETLMTFTFLVAMIIIVFAGLVVVALLNKDTSQFITLPSVIITLGILIFIVILFVALLTKVI